jgi:hypothetical protein
MSRADRGAVRGVCCMSARWLALAAAAIGVSACTVYDPRPDRAAVAPRAPSRTVRVCGEANEFAFAERILAATRLFAGVRSCSEPFDQADLQVRVWRPYPKDKDLIAVTFLYMVLTAGVVPMINCHPDLGFAFNQYTAPVEVVPDRSTCVLTGWLPMLLTPLPGFHFGKLPDATRAADALRNAILTEAPSVIEPPTAAPPD